jgi:penicillin-binding protein 1A
MRFKIFIILTISILLIIGTSFYIFILKGLPSIAELKRYSPAAGTKIYAEDNALIGEFKIERGRFTPIGKMPRHLIQAVIATEDSRFFKHRGIDYLSIIRALVKDTLYRGFKEGGSTITQQLAKILYLNPEKTIRRKLREALIAIKLEKELTKEEILELYLNRVYFGNGAYGVGMAALNFFGKEVTDLNVKEAAMLAGLLKSPGKYSPFQNPKQAENRAKIVLRRMEKEGFLRPSERRRAESLQLKFGRAMENEDVYGYFLGYVKSYLESRYGKELIYKGGLHVYTTLRRWAQIQAVRALKEGIEMVDKKIGWRGPVGYIDKLNIQNKIRSATDADIILPLKGHLLKALVLRVYKDRAVLNVNGAYGILKLEDSLWAKRIYSPDFEEGYNLENFNLTEILSPGDLIHVKVKKVDGGIAYMSLEQKPLIEGALIAIQPKTGYIKAMVGGYDFRRSRFNRAVNARRQAGSAFKPLLYALALKKGYTPASIIKDEPVSYRTGKGTKWEPVNYDRRFHGSVRLREALVNSLNVATVRLAESIGIKEMVRFTREFGLSDKIPPDLSLALGSVTVSPLRLTASYTAFANGGRRMTPLAVKRVVTSDGRVLENNHQRGKITVSPGVAFIITSILEDVIRRGTGRKAYGLNVASAGKTGTTDDFRDAWFIGYTPSMLCGVWIGYDNGRSLGDGMSGGVVAAPIWYNFMKGVIRSNKVSFVRPEDVVKYYIDKKTGLRVIGRPENSMPEYFIKGTEPEFKSADRLKRLFKRLFRRTPVN